MTFPGVLVASLSLVSWESEGKLESTQPGVARVVLCGTMTDGASRNRQNHIIQYRCLSVPIGVGREQLLAEETPRGGVCSRR